MKIKPAIHSSFPRIGEHPDEQKLRRAYASLEDGKITAVEFEQIQDQAVDDVIDIQERAGLEVLTDGLLRWHDPVSHLARNFKGFEINGLLRLFDTNFYYRQPVISGNIASGNGLLAKEIAYAKSKTAKPIKSIMLGPVSLAGMSLNKSDHNFEKLCHRTAELLASEIHKLEQAGASYIQIEEPFLVRNPEYFELFADSFEKLATAKAKAQLILALYFGNAGKIMNRLPQVNADIIGLDFTYSSGLLQQLESDGFTKPIAFGILDGRNTKIESADQIARDLEPLLAKINLPDCQLTTSCGLEYLPKPYAIKKLELTSAIAKKLNG